MSVVSLRRGSLCRSFSLLSTLFLVRVHKCTAAVKLCHKLEQMDPILGVVSNGTALTVLGTLSVIATVVILPAALCNLCFIASYVPKKERMAFAAPIVAATSVGGLGLYGIWRTLPRYVLPQSHPRVGPDGGAGIYFLLRSNKFRITSSLSRLLQCAVSL
jgi:hypothetical protein